MEVNQCVEWKGEVSLLQFFTQHTKRREITTHEKCMRRSGGEMLGNNEITQGPVKWIEWRGKQWKSYCDEVSAAAVVALNAHWRAQLAAMATPNSLSDKKLCKLQQLSKKKVHAQKEYWSAVLYPPVWCPSHGWIKTEKRKKRERPSCVFGEKLGL